MEGIGLTHLRPALQTRRRQYGYKQKCSVLVAAVDANNAILDPRYKHWIVYKLDVNAAFDSISRSAVLSIILNLDCADTGNHFSGI